MPAQLPVLPQRPHQPQQDVQASVAPLLAAAHATAASQLRLVDVQPGEAGRLLRPVEQAPDPLSDIRVVLGMTASRRGLAFLGRECLER